MDDPEKPIWGPALFFREGDKPAVGFLAFVALINPRGGPHKQPPPSISRRGPGRPIISWVGEIEACIDDPGA